jgi:hypothetical protein
MITAPPFARLSGALLLVCAVSCSNGPSGPPTGSGGDIGSGGLPSGGSSSGGVSAGGTGSGGTASGGTESGGAPSGGSTSGGASSGGSGGSDEPAPSGAPALLSDAGLYEADMVTLAPGVRPFTPGHQLWSDDATKHRWIYLPEDTQIDTSKMDYWQYPPGTRLYKEFSQDGVRIETRLLHRQDNGAWWRVAYQWREDQTEADAVPDGVMNAAGTDHDIPSSEDCGTCHLRMPDKVLGFSAVQLAHESADADEWTLDRLVAEGRLTDAPPAIQIPGDATEQAALGYLHANCGHCHNPKSSVSSRVAIGLWLETGLLGSVAETRTYTSTVGKTIDLAEGAAPGATLIVDPGSPDTSALFVRVSSRGEEYAMPPLGTEVVDPDGVQAIEDWIQGL